MCRRFLLTICALFATVTALWLASIATAGQSTAGSGLPRTPWGDPDLQGIWNNTEMIGVPLEAQDEQALRERQNSARASGEIVIAPPDHWLDGARTEGARVRKSLIVDPPDGRLPPLTPEAQMRWEAKARARQGVGTDEPRPGYWVDDLHLWVRCITRGLPDAIFPRAYNNNYQIVQTPEYLVILYEMIHDARIIPLDGRPHLPDNVRQLMGDSRGRWEGATLVVETTNFSSMTESNLIPNGGGGWGSGTYRGAGETLHRVERFTRVAADRIEYRATLNDPKLYTRPWTVAFPLTTRDSPDRILEYACHEGNYGVKHILLAAVARDKAAEQAAKAKK